MTITFRDLVICNPDHGAMIVAVAYIPADQPSPTFGGLPIAKVQVSIEVPPI
jgi:hypothetical protein